MIPDISNRNVIILGPPQAGKSTLAKKIKTKHHYLINTDHFGNEYGYENGLYYLINFINKEYKNYSNFIIEGTLAYRLLRKLNLLNIKIDLIINLQSNKSITPKQQTLHKGNTSIYNMFLGIAAKDITIVNINNEEI